MNNSNSFLSIFLLVIIWQSVSLLASSDVFPSVVDILKSFFDHLLNKDLLFHIGVTLQRVIIAFFIAMFFGVILGIMMGLSSKINAFFDIFLIIGLNIPALVTIIICYIWFGLTDFSAIIINKVPIIIVNIRQGVLSMDKKYFQLAQIYSLSSKELIKNIYLPQIYPYMMATTRLTISLIWKIVLVVELLGRSDGVGFQIAIFFQDFDIKSIFAYSFAFIFIVVLVEKIILNPIENRAKKWR